MKKIITLAKWIVVMLVVSISLIPTSSAYAASCYRASCNNRDPYVTGCAGGGASWRVLDMRYIYHYATGANIGYVQLWWSDTCQTNWARVVSTSGPKYIKAYLYNNGGEASSIFSSGSQNVVIGTMQNGYNILWGACGAMSDVYAAHASGSCTPMH